MKDAKPPAWFAPLPFCNRDGNNDPKKIALSLTILSTVCFAIVLTREGKSGWQNGKNGHLEGKRKFETTTAKGQKVHNSFHGKTKRRESKIQGKKENCVL